MTYIRTTFSNKPRTPQHTFVYTQDFLLPTSFIQAQCISTLMEVRWNLDSASARRVGQR